MFNNVEMDGYLETFNGKGKFCIAITFASTEISGNPIVSLLFFCLIKLENFILNLHCLRSGSANRCILKSGQIGTTL